MLASLTCNDTISNSLYINYCIKCGYVSVKPTYFY